MAKAIVQKTQVEARNVEALNRTAVHTAEIENGMVFLLQNYQNTAPGVWDLVAPSTGNLSGLWMAFDEGKILVQDANSEVYSGLSKDPGLYTNIANRPFDCFKPQVGDIITMTADAIGNTRTAETLITAVDASLKLEWAGAAGAGLTLTLIDANAKFNIPPKTFGGTVTTGFKFEVTAV